MSSITKELREWAHEHLYKSGIRSDLLAIADRIDAEHERAVMSAMNDALYHANDESMAELGWVRLPKDAEGVSIRVGDWITGRWDAKAKVVAVTSDDVYWWEPDGCHWCHAFEVRHYHKPTVEDVLREFALRVAGKDCITARPEVFEEFAAKLRLAGDAE